MASKETHTLDAELPLHQFLTYRMSRVQAQLNAQASRILKQHAGLTLSQWRIIALIGNAGKARPSALASEAHLDKGLLSRNLKPLIAKGMVMTSPDETDQRAQILSLTGAGQKMYERTLPIMRKRQMGLRAVLEDDELETLFRALEKLEVAAGQQEFPE